MGFLLAGCSGTSLPVAGRDAASDQRSALSDGPGVDRPTGDGSAGAEASCVTVTLTVLGCDAERLAECEREYVQLGSGVAAAIDAYAQCVRTNFAWHSSTMWPTGPADGAACNPVGLEDAWQHGACQFQAAAVYGAIEQITCSGNSTGCADAGAGNCGFQCDLNTVTDACTSIPCTEVPLTCMGAPGCTYTPLAICGNANQPTCYFTGTL